MVQLRLLADIEAFDLTHVYLTLKVLDQEGEGQEEFALVPHTPGVLRLTLPQCHVLLRALREFDGLIELTTPVMEEAMRLRSRKSKIAAPGNGQAEEVPKPLESLIERLSTQNGDHATQGESASP